MKDLRGRDFGYPMMVLAEAFACREAFSVGWERHETWEFHHVLSGTINYEFGGGRTIELHGGMYLAIPPRVRHRTTNGLATPSTRLAVRWSPDRPGMRGGQSPLFLTKRRIADIFAAFAHAGIRARVMPPAMVRATKELFRSIQRDGGRPAVDAALAAALMRHRCNEMLVCLALAQTLPEPIAKDADVVAGVKEFIHAHLGEKLRMQDLVRISGYGSTQLTKLFLSKSGLTPNGYIVRSRVEKARRLLSETRLPLTEIALQCGFPSGSYFATVFRKYCNQSPVSIRTGA